MSVEKLIYDPTAGPGIAGVCGNCLNGGHHICDSENCKCKANGHKAWWWVPQSNKIELWTPWEWEEITSHLPGKEAQGTTIMSSGGHYVCHQLNIRPAKQRQELAHAICSAINGTYGSGINPEAAKEMFDAINMALEIKELWMPYYEETPPEHEGEFQALYAMLDKFKLAIKKAKL